MPCKSHQLLPCAEAGEGKKRGAKVSHGHARFIVSSRMGKTDCLSMGVNAMTPTITFQGGPMTSDMLPRSIQIFTSDGAHGKHNEQLPYVFGTYVLSDLNEESAIYEWRGVSKEDKT